MAAKTAAADVVKEKLASYEISPKWIFIYLAINYVVQIAYSVFYSKTIYFFLCYLFIHLAIFSYFFLNWFIPVKSNNMPSKVYHPDLMPKEDFERLNERFQEVANKKGNYYQTDQPIPEKCQQEYDNLKSIIDAQIELRIICWLKYVIGVPKDSGQGNATSNLQKSSNIKDKIPSYEISSKWFLIYLAINFAFEYFIFVSPSLLPSKNGGNSFFAICHLCLYLCYFFTYPFLLFFYGEYCSTPISSDIPSKIYHPNLMPQKEFENLKKRFEEIENMKYNYYKAGQIFPKKYQQEYDHLKTVFDEQVELRKLCWFKYVIGVPKFSLHENATNAIEESSDKKDAENALTSTSDNVKDELENFSKSVSSDFDGTTASIIADKNMESDVGKLASENAEMKNDFENLKIQVAEIKTEITKLKNFVENFIESQTVF